MVGTNAFPYFPAAWSLPSRAGGKGKGKGRWETLLKYLTINVSHSSVCVGVCVCEAFH